MPDISMCQSTMCPLSDTCRRHENGGAIPSRYQSYGDFEYSEECDYYWPVSRERTARRKGGTE